MVVGILRLEPFSGTLSLDLFGNYFFAKLEPTGVSFEAKWMKFEKVFKFFFHFPSRLAKLDESVPAISRVDLPDVPAPVARSRSRFRFRIDRNESFGDFSSLAWLDDLICCLAKRIATMRRPSFVDFWTNRLRSVVERPNWLWVQIPLVSRLLRPLKPTNWCVYCADECNLNFQICSQVWLLGNGPSLRNLVIWVQKNLLDYRLRCPQLEPTCAEALSIYH